MGEYFLANIRTSAHKLATGRDGCPLTTEEAIVKTDGDRQCPADMDEEITARIKDMAVKAHIALGCRDFSLYDIRINEAGEPHFLEACNFCSFSPKSAMVAMTNAAKRPHPEVFHMMMEWAALRKVGRSGCIQLHGGKKMDEPKHTADISSCEAVMA